MSHSVSDVFLSFQEHLDGEQDIREEIRLAARDIEQTARGILTLLQAIHQQAGINTIPEVCEKSKAQFATIRDQYQVLKSKVPEGQYYRSCSHETCKAVTLRMGRTSRFHDHWRFVTQRLCFLAALTIYLEEERLVQREQVADLLGVCVEQDKGFHLDLDDYLSGLLMLADELSRFAVNSVTAGNYSWPMKISTFVTEMNLGFRLLNLKNDNLRKKFDALKYDLKKVEEVVYDLSIRGLKPSGDADLVPKSG
uniref:Translin n=1 Tax=Rhipicephalus zambeziensis TaxID=60191 RepID=A0A224YPR6_9ACAR